MARKSFRQCNKKDSFSKENWTVLRRFPSLGCENMIFDHIFVTFYRWYGKISGTAIENFLEKLLFFTKKHFRNSSAVKISIPGLEKCDFWVLFCHFLSLVWKHFWHCHKKHSKDSSARKISSPELEKYDFWLFFCHFSKQRCMMFVTAWEQAMISLVRYFLFEPSNCQAPWWQFPQLVSTILVRLPLVKIRLRHCHPLQVRDVLG